VALINYFVVALSVCLAITLFPSCAETVNGRGLGITSRLARPLSVTRQGSQAYLLINVSDYDGESDGERIQKALNDVGEGAIVFIPGGIWEACNLTAFSNTFILGTNGTILKRPQNTTKPFVTFENQAHFAVSNVTFDGQNVTYASGIQITNGTDFQIAYNMFQDIAQHAVHILGECRDFYVENNTFFHTNEAPLLIFGSPSIREINGFVVANNTLLMSDYNGKIGVAFAANGTIADNYLYNCTYGIATRCVSDLLIRNNKIEGCTSFGIYLGTQPGDIGSDNVDIIENTISGSNVGIARYYGGGSMVNITVRNNTITNNLEIDIYADFPGYFINNTLSSKKMLRLLTIPLQFTGNVDVNMTMIIPADINIDGKVNMRDVATIARLYETSQDSHNWNPAADVIQDGIINMKDTGFAARCFAP
jgi:hypothetical protein